MTYRKLIFTFFACALCLYAPYYVYNEMSWVVEMTFLDPDRWNRSGWADNDAFIPFETRLFYLALWASPISVGAPGLLVGAFICWKAQSGNYFDAMLADAIALLGLCMIVSAGLAILAGSISPMIVSWHNINRPLPLRFWHGSNPVVMLSGFGFMMFGMIMRDAIKLSEENKEFV